MKSGENSARLLYSSWRVCQVRLRSVVVAARDVNERTRNLIRTVFEGRQESRASACCGEVAAQGQFYERKRFEFFAENRNKKASLQVSNDSRKPISTGNAFHAGNKPPSVSAARTDRLLSGGLKRQIFLLALPTFFQQFLTFCVGMFDTWLSGQIDAAATSAIGVSAYFGWLGSLVVSTVGIGTAAVVARHCGASEPAKANHVMNVSLLVATVLSFCMSAAMYAGAPFIVELFQLTGRTAEVGLNYLRLDSVGHLLTGITIVGAAALRGSGNMRSPMIVLGTVSVLNIIASLLMVYGVGPEKGININWDLIPAMGVYGIAAGTVTARLIGGLIMLAVLIVGSDPLKVRFALLKPDFEIIARLFRLGIFAAGDSIINWFGQVGFLIIIKQVQIPGISSDAIFAAHVVGIQVEAITYLPAMAWGQAAGTMIGQSLGAKRIKRAFQSGLAAAAQCCLFGLFITVVFFFGAEKIYGLMHTDAGVVSTGTPAFQAMAGFQIPLIIFLVLRSGLHGAGDTRWPMVVTIIGLFTLRLPLAWLMGVYLQGGLVGAWVGMFADILFRCLAISYRYLKAGWVRVKV